MPLDMFFVGAYSCYQTVRPYLLGVFINSSVNGAFDKVSEYMMWKSYGKLVGVVDDANEFNEVLENGSRNQK